MTMRSMTLVCFLALLAPALAEVIFEKQVGAAPSAHTHYSVAHINLHTGAVELRLKADFLAVADDQPRHVAGPQLRPHHLL